MEELEQLDKELEYLIIETEEKYGIEKANKIFEKHNIPEKKEIEVSQEINERG